MSRQNEFKGFALFNIMLTPHIVVIGYWIATAVILGFDYWFLINDNMNMVFMLAIALVVTRIVFELVMLAFKNNEYLRRICAAQEFLVNQHPPDEVTKAENSEPPTCQR